jgi:hypothetical protein
MLEKLLEEAAALGISSVSIASTFNLNKGSQTHCTLGAVLDDLGDYELWVGTARGKTAEESLKNLIDLFQKENT